MQIVTTVKPGLATAVMTEIAAVGFATIKATSAQDAAQKATASPALLFTDEASWSTLSGVSRPLLERAMRDNRLRIIMIGAQASVASELIECTIAPDMPLGSAIEALHQAFQLNRRKQARAEITMPGAWTAEGKTTPGVVRSVSESGAGFVSSAQSPAVGSVGEISFAELSIRCIVMNERRFERAVGVRFDRDALDEDTRDILKRMVGDALGTTVRQGRRAIVYDSSTLLLRMLQGLLAQAGFETTTTDDVNELADRCTRERFDLVVLDPLLPALRSGRMAEIRRRVGKVPLVLHSNASAEAMKAAAAQHHANDWVRKGTFTDVLLAKLSAVATVPDGASVMAKPAAPKPRVVAAVPTPAAPVDLEAVSQETPAVEAKVPPVDPNQKRERYNTDKILAMERQRTRKKMLVALSVVGFLIVAAVCFVTFKPAAPPHDEAPVAPAGH